MIVWTKEGVSEHWLKPQPSYQRSLRSQLTYKSSNTSHKTQQSQQQWYEHCYIVNENELEKSNTHNKIKQYNFETQLMRFREWDEFPLLYSELSVA